MVKDDGVKSPQTPNYMAFWSTQRFTEEQKKEGMIEKFDSSRLRCGKYELRLSREVLTTPVAEKKTEPGNRDRVLSIQPGQFAFLFTEEVVKVPVKALAFISMKTAKKWEGLVNISGFHVDPGFSGRLKFSVFNAGSQPIHLEYGEGTFLIWFAEFDVPVNDPYNGEHNNQNRITRKDYTLLDSETHSPASVAARVAKLESICRTAKAVLIVIILPLIIGVFGAAAGFAFEHHNHVSSFARRRIQTIRQMIETLRPSKGSQSTSPPKTSITSPTPPVKTMQAEPAVQQASPEHSQSTGT